MPNDLLYATGGFEKHRAYLITEYIIREALGQKLKLPKVHSKHPAFSIPSPTKLNKSSLKF
jgi:hypothetical protein